MERKDALRKSKDSDGKNKPGIIVAGPQAHARERAGKMPVGKDARQTDEAAKKPASRPGC